MPIKFNLEQYQNDTFIETGTYEGEGLAYALELDFDNYLSVDLYEEYVQKARNRFGDQAQIFQGHSPEFLRDQIDPELGNITFWLDAHGGGLAQDYADLDPDKKCPVYEEIEVITEKIHSGSHVVMIDDIRMMDGMARGKEGVNVDGVKSRLEKLPGDVEFVFENGVEENDVLIALC